MLVTAALAAPVCSVGDDAVDETTQQARELAASGLLHLDEGRLEAAFGAFERALELDPTDAMIHHWQSIVLMERGRTAAAVEAAKRARALDSTAKPPDDWGDHIGHAWQLTELGRTEEAVREARRMWERWSPGGPAMPRIYGDFLFVAYHYDRAIAQFEMTLALNPEGESAPAYHSYSEVLSFRGQHDEAVRMMRGAFERDASSAFLSSELAQRLLEARDYPAAIEQFEATLELQSARFTIGALFGLARAYAETGAYDQALIRLERVAESNQFWDTQALTAYIHARAGEQPKARALVEQMEERDADPVWIATIYAELGEIDNAFAWLDSAYGVRSQGLMKMKIDPRFDVLRTDARYGVLLEKVGLE